MRLLVTIAALCIVIGCSPRGEKHLEAFVGKCQQAGLHAEVKKTFKDRCAVQIDATDDIHLLPRSTGIDLELVIAGRTIDSSTITQLTKSRRIISLEFQDCSFDSMSLQAIRDAKPNSLVCKNSTWRGGGKGVAKSTSPVPIYQLEMENCDPQLTDGLLDCMGFAYETYITMRNGHLVTVGKSQKHIVKLMVDGCELHVDKDFVETTALNEIIIIRSRLTAEAISRLFHIKSLVLIGIHQYNIESTEWDKFTLPPSCSSGLVILTSGRLQDYLNENLVLSDP